MNPISHLVEGGESEQAAFKGPRTPLESVAQTVCALLNQQGGTVLWGVDSRGTVAGVPDAEAKARSLNDFLMQHLTPRPLLSVSAEEFKGQRLVLVEIPRGADKPYSLERRIWVRLGKQDLRASADESARMVEASAIGDRRWEREAVPGFELTGCDAAELSEARREIAVTGRFGITVPEEDEELLRRLYLQSGGQLTHAAMVLFARDPVAWSPSVGLRIISYPSGKQGRSLHEQTLQGPAVRVLRQAVSVVQQQTGFTAHFKSTRLEREDRPAYALFALREGLVNAIVHRDYGTVGAQLRVEIFPEHLIIQNPGRLPEGWTEKDILTKEESHPTNPDIARVFYLRSLMERLGIGGRKLDEACRALKAKPPVWKAEKDMVSLTLFRAPSPARFSQLTSRQQLFLLSLTHGHNFKVDDYATDASVSVRQARRDLAELAELGLLERVGKGRATFYRRIGRVDRE
jgi:ATP-dependent DNA helicase RecG